MIAHEAAIAYIRRGWSVVPIPFRQKGPAIKEWQNLRLIEADLLQHFNSQPMNVGVLLGEPSGLIDIDLDASEAAKLARNLLPPTGSIFGRKGKPSSHRLYTSAVGKKTTERFTGPAGDSLVEIRGTGAQTIFPGSVHPNGEPIEWELDDDPQHVDLPQLVMAVRELAAAALLLRMYPSQGSRHNFVLGLAGGLLRGSWSVSKIERYIEVIATAAGDEEVESRILQVTSTKAAIDRGDKATGWPSLSELIDGAGPKAQYVDRIRQLIADNTLHQRSESRVLSTPTSSPPRLWVPFPVEVLPLPIRTFVLEGAEATGVDPVMYVLPVLAVCAASIGTSRRMRIKRTWREPSILWTAAVARSGRVKSPPFDDAVRPLKKRETQSLRDHEDVLLEHDRDIARWELQTKAWKAKGHEENLDPPLKPDKPEASRLITTDPTTEAVATLLSHNARGLLLCRDELSGWFGGFNAYRGGKGADVSCWLEMYRGGMMIVDRKTAERIIHCDHASVSVTGTIQPQILRRVLTQEHFDAGLSARLLMAMPPARPKRWTDTELSESTEMVYDHIVGKLLTLQHNVDADGRVSPVDIEFTPAARRMFIQFFNRHGVVQDATQDDRLAAAYGKLEAVAARLALIFHFIRWADDDPTLTDPNVVDEQDVTAGITVTRWFIHETERVYDLFDEDETVAQARDLLDWVMLQGGVATPRDLQKHSRAYPTSEAATAALDDLVQRRWGHWAYDKTGPAGGRPSRRFYAATETAVDNTSTGGIVSGGIVHAHAPEDEK